MYSSNLRKNYSVKLLGAQVSSIKIHRWDVAEDQLVRVGDVILHISINDKVLAVRSNISGFFLERVPEGTVIEGNRAIARSVLEANSEHEIILFARMLDWEDPVEARAAALWESDFFDVKADVS